VVWQVMEQMARRHTKMAGEVFDQGMVRTSLRTNRMLKEMRDKGHI
jgi:hypothetical protein